MVSITDAVTNEGAPRDIVDAAQKCDNAIQAGLTPNRELMQYVQQWLSRQRGNNRYGK